jgi:hypothetical protein
MIALYRNKNICEKNVIKNLYINFVFFYDAR